jgi:hypothetical protein
MENNNKNEILVRQHYPNAYVERDGALFFCFVGAGKDRKV